MLFNTGYHLVDIVYSSFTLGYEPSDPVHTPIREALPLADMPHLLNPSARRDQLFGSTKSVGDDPNLDIPQYIGFGTNCKGKYLVFSGR